MMKTFEKRLLSLLVAALMVISLFTVTASAESEAHPASIVLDELGVEIYMYKDLNELLDNGYANNQYFVDGGDSYSFKALAAAGCGTSSKFTGVIENITEEDLTISFDYSYDGKQYLISKSFDYTDAANIVLDNYIGDSSYTVTLAPAEALYITILYAENANSTTNTTFTVSNLEKVDSTTHDLTVKGMVGGTVICGTDRITASTPQKTYQVLPKDMITLNAVADSGYNFVAFVDCDTNTVLSSDTSYSFATSKDMNVSAYFVYKGTQAYRSGSLNSGYSIYSDFNEAAQVAAASNGIFMPLQDFTLPAGEYTIPAGATLLIPFDEKATCYTNNPANIQDVDQAKNPRPYRVLTLADGAHITSAGSISVSAKHYAASQNSPSGLSTVAGYYGQIDMKDGSSIVLQDGANLYAWGYITGQFNNGYGSSIVAQSGATVYELFQMCDFRGGTATMNIANGESRVFPFTQYYIQNIETNLICHKGASEKFTGSLIASESLGQASATFIGEGGLFNIISDNATISKYYNPVEDKLYFTLDGADTDVENNLAVTLRETLTAASGGSEDNPEYTAADFVLSKINLKIFVPGLINYSLNSSDFLLPINNMDITIDNSVVVVTNEIELLPDCKMTVGENCAVTLSSIKKEVTQTTASGDAAVVQKAEPASLYIIDAADWKAANPVHNSQGFASAEKSISQLYYSPSRDKNGSKRTVIRNSSKLQDATLDVNGQILCMGNYNTGKSGICTSKSGAAIISSTGAGQIMFMNDTSVADTCYAYNQGTSEFVDLEARYAKLKNDDGTYVSTENRTLTVTDIPAELKAALIEQCKIIAQQQGRPVTLANMIYNNQISKMIRCERYYLKQDSNGDYAWYKNKMNSETDRDFVPSTTFKNDDGTVLYQGWASYGTAPVYKGSVPVKASDAANSYTFKAWDPSISEAITADATYTATYTQTAITYYTVKWVNADGTTLEEDRVTFGTAPSYDGADPVKDADEYCTYEFAGWDKALDPVTADVTFTATFNSTLRTYKVKWVDDDGTEFYSEDLAYGVDPCYDGVPSSKPADQEGYSKVFSHWTPDVASVTGDATYTAVYELSYDGAFVAHSLTLNGMIGVNFFVKLTPGELNGQKVEFTANDVTTVVYLENIVDDYDEDMGAFKVQALVSAPEMTDGIKARLLNADGTLVSVDNYKAASYADATFADASVTDEALKELVRSMLNYGAQAQKYFKHHESELADAHLDAAVNYGTVTLTDVAERLAAANSGEASTDVDSAEVQAALAAYGVQYTGMSLVLNSDTVIRLYFSVTDADKLSAADITFNGKQVTPTACSEGVYFDCSVPAAELDELKELKIGDVSVKCCALDYMVTALEESSSDADLMKVLEALYWYNVYADEYFTV